MTADSGRPRSWAPLFVEREPRGIANVSDPEPLGEWHPANDAARKLWACLEPARDIEDLLRDRLDSIPQRRLKSIVVPLESLRVAVTQLGNYLSTSSEMKQLLPPAARSGISAALSDLGDSPSFREPADLRAIRNTLGAHIDRDIESRTAQAQLARLASHQVGMALHECLTVLVSFLHLDVYKWSASDCPDGFVRLMGVEPSLTTLRLEDGAPVEIVRVDIVISPRYSIQSLCESLAQEAWSMLASGDA